MADLTALPETYCVVGAGASGLIAARAFRRCGIAVEVFERDPQIGGIWNVDHPNSPVYASCNFISDRTHSGFIGFRMPKAFAMYPTWRNVRAYIQEFARLTDLAGIVRCDTEVLSAVPVTVPGGSYWRVTLSTGEVRQYRGVIWACGQQQYPHMPEIPGADSFKGELYHSSRYKRGEQFLDRRVLVVGAGNSGVDIACDASVFARRALLSMRRGYWFLPKRLFGQGLASFLDRSASMPAGFPDIATMPMDALWTMVLSTMGELVESGLPAPDHQFGATHPVVNEHLPYQIAHGKLQVRPDIERIEGEHVIFVDGTSEPVDVIVCATGYRVAIPWLDPGVVDWLEDEPDFHLGTFSRRVDGLYAVGLVHFGGHTYSTWDQLAQLAAADAHATLTGENAENVRRLKHEYDRDLRGPVPLLDVHRNLRQVDIGTLRAMFDDVRQRFAIEMPEEWDEHFYPVFDSEMSDWNDETWQNA